MPILDVDQMFFNSDSPPKPFTTRTCGLDPQAFKTEEEKDLTVGAILRPILLYTVAPVPGQPRNQPPPVLDPEEKFDRTAIVLKIREGGKITLRDEDVALIIKAIGVLPTEPYGMLRTLLQAIKTPAPTG